MPTYNFEVIRRQVQAELSCKTCGATVKRTFIGECTVNPFNKNGGGEICSREEVAAQSLASARRQAEKAKAEGVVCQWCSERPIREALIRFLDGEPMPENKWNSPTRYLADRKNVEERYGESHCEHCGETAWKSLGFELTTKGRRVAEDLKAKATARGEYPFVTLPPMSVREAA